VRRTDEIAGDDKNISNEVIALTIYSPHVLDLTMVDLPGITKVPVRGQSLDIEEMIQDLILQFIEQDNALILAISSAN
jgi:replication fork clamp-binding protein CrfC